MLFILPVLKMKRWDRREKCSQKRSLVMLCLRLLPAVVLYVFFVELESTSTSEGNPEFSQNSGIGFQGLYQKQTLPIWSFPRWGIHVGCSLAGYSKHLWDFLFGKFPSSHFAILQVQYAPKFYSCLLNCRWDWMCWFVWLVLSFQR